MAPWFPNCFLFFSLALLNQKKEDVPFHPTCKTAHSPKQSLFLCACHVCDDNLFSCLSFAFGNTMAFCANTVSILSSAVSVSASTSPHSCVHDFLVMHILYRFSPIGLLFFPFCLFLHHCEILLDMYDRHELEPLHASFYHTFLFSLLHFCLSPWKTLLC